MAIIRKLNGITPKIGNFCFLAETAVLIGDIDMGNHCSVWYNAVLRGDVNGIKLGNRVNIQDNVTVHGTENQNPTTLGNSVTIGHNAIVHGCIIEDFVLIGMGSIVMDKAFIETHALVAAGAVVTQGTHIRSGELYAGVPARKIKTVSAQLVKDQIERIAEGYVTYASWYKE